MKTFITILACLFLASCAGIQFKSPEQEAITRLAVSVSAKALGLKAKEMGLQWTDQIETAYQTVIAGDNVSLDAAQAAEKYIREYFDPLLVPDMIELARLVGFTMDTSVIDTSGVDMELLKIALAGFRIAVM